MKKKKVKKAPPKFVHEIVKLLTKAQKIATKNGHGNLLQPGLVKELIIGDILGHEVHKTKHKADAWDPKDPTKLYEYLTCLDNKGSFQIDRVFKSPEKKRKKSLQNRVIQYDKFYCAIFYKDQPLTIKEIYEVETRLILNKTRAQLRTSSNDISHVCFSIRWVEQNGTLVYPQ